MFRKIIDHLKSDWYKYLLEIVVVILGILIAYNLEQWSGEKNNKKKEIEILKDFKRGLSADLSEIRGNIFLHECSIRSTKIILRVIAEDLPYHDSLDACFSFTHSFTTFNGKVSPIEELKNTNLSLVSNDSLRLEIISMYDEAYNRVRMVEAVIERDYEQLRHIDRLYFDAYDTVNLMANTSMPPPPWGVLHPLKFSELKKDPEYAAMLRARLSNQSGLLRLHYIPTKNALKELLRKIDAEIKRLED